MHLLKSPANGLYDANASAVGAAAAVARLLKLDGNDTKELLNIASSLTLATSRKTMLEGGTVRNTYAGISNQMALMSLKLLTAGFCGETDGIKSVFGSVVSNNLDENKARENIGARFEINRNYFKLYSCCRYNHAALDCLLHLIERHPELRNFQRIDAIYLKIDMKSVIFDLGRPRKLQSHRGPSRDPKSTPNVNTSTPQI